jgi:hypothetical protein
MPDGANRRMANVQRPKSQKNTQAPWSEFSEIVAMTVHFKLDLPFKSFPCRESCRNCCMTGFTAWTGLNTRNCRSAAFHFRTSEIARCSPRKTRNIRHRDQSPTNFAASSPTQSLRVENSAWTVNSSRTVKPVAESRGGEVVESIPDEKRGCGPRQSWPGFCRDLERSRIFPTSEAAAARAQACRRWPRLPTARKRKPDP